MSPSCSFLCSPIRSYYLRPNIFPSYLPFKNGRHIKLLCHIMPRKKTYPRDLASIDQYAGIVLSRLCTPSQLADRHILSEFLHLVLQFAGLTVTE